MRELVCIITYRRPELVEACIASLQPFVGKEVELLVVDNDPAMSAAQVAERFPSVTYDAEPTPGIAAARNRALEVFHGSDYSGLSFIDDDETATASWLDEHLRIGSEHDADASFGPVIPDYAPEVPRWVQKLDFFARAQGRDGDAPKWPATNNVRISGTFLRQNPNLRFSEEYSLSGGSDTDFFYRATLAGAKLVWAESARVREVVPAERGNARWLWRRGLRLGNVSARMLRRKGWSRAKIAVVGTARTAATPVLALLAVVRRRPLGPTLMNFPKGIGMLQSSRGKLTWEYARSAPDATE